MYMQAKPTWRPSTPSFALVDCAICQGTGWDMVSTSGFPCAKRCSCRDLTRLVKLKESIGVPLRYEHCTLNNFEPLNVAQIRALGAARRFMERFPGLNRGLFFSGDPGTGKTHLAAAILRNLAGRMQESLLFADFELTLPERDRKGIDPDGRRRYEQNLRQVSLLVLDNFGAATPSVENVRATQQLLDARLQHGRLTILTGETVKCRELFGGRPSPKASRTQVFLSALHPAFLMRLLSALRIIAFVGEDHRRFHAPLFP